MLSRRYNAAFTPLLAQIYRFEPPPFGEVISGTEDILLEPGVDLSNLNLEHAYLADVDLTGSNLFRQILGVQRWMDPISPTQIFRMQS